MSVHIPSLQLVMGLPDSNKGGAMRHILFLGPWAGLLESPDREFHLHRSLQIPGRIGYSFLCLLPIAY